MLIKVTVRVSKNITTNILLMQMGILQTIQGLKVGFMEDLERPNPVQLALPFEII